jgi:hypothetical protein
VRLNRRDAAKQLVALMGSSALLGQAAVSEAQEVSATTNPPPVDDPLLEPICVMDFEPLCQGQTG